MAKQTSNPEIKARPHCSILESVTSRGTDLSLKEKLEDEDLDILGVPHVSRSRHEHDYAGVSDSWFD